MSEGLSKGGNWSRELRFLARDRTALVALGVLLLLASLAAAVGMLRVSAQERDIERMLVADAADREAAQARLSDFGDAGYYSFFITYDDPEPLAFAAMGQRDTAPYLKRIRLLALEGQIYMGESPNPLLAQIGSLDLAFVAAYVLPLILIVLLYDLKASERVAGRLTFLEAMPHAARRLWVPRVALRALLAFLAIAIPLVVGAVLRGAGVGILFQALLGLALLTAVWAAIASAVALRPWPAATIGTTLVGVWLLLAVILPSGVQNLVLRTVEGPEGADVSLVQREAVNDAWDVPKADTLEPFADLFPQYVIEEELEGFDWRWYFAFQHMGDVAAADLSEAYRATIRKRDRLAGLAAWLSPAIAIQRHLQALGGTDVTAQLAYDAKIRRYHAELQAFFLPLMFEQVPFDPEILRQAPAFDPT